MYTRQAHLKYYIDQLFPADHHTLAACTRHVCIVTCYACKHVAFMTWAYHCA